MKTLLFAVSSATSYRLHRSFAQYCAAQGHAVHLVYDGAPDALFEEVRADASTWRGTAESLDALVTTGARPRFSWLRTPRPWRAWLFGRLAPVGKSVHRRLLGERLAAAQSLLQRLRPAVLIVAEDGISGPAALIAAARSLGVPVADLPYGYGTQADLDNALDEKAATEPLNAPHGSAGNWLRRFAAQWIKRGRHAGTILFVQDYILAREAWGMTLRDAWIVHGGYADCLLAESEQMMDLYRAEGIPKHKTKLTGSPYCDVMAQALRRNAAAQAAFRQARTIDEGVLRILVSWPTSYHATRPGYSEFDTYENMTRTVLGWLQSLPGCELTVSLHPAVPAHLRAQIEGLGIRISDEYVIALIPQYDIYISYFSSTQRWALACGKPVVNYDAYGVGLRIYDHAPGFVGTRRFEDFKARMGELIQLDTGFLPMARAQSQQSASWGIVDGRCSERVLAEILALSE